MPETRGSRNSPVRKCRNADIEQPNSCQPLDSPLSSSITISDRYLQDEASSLSGNHTPETPLSSLPEPSNEVLDLICIGFGPASLATAIAIHDTLPGNARPKCLYLEKQSQFAWHSGMQIPGAKMQISFLKDLATTRQPTSTFTFINYLHSVGRLHAFINLGTFLPSRKEFEAYLKWCASRVEKGDQVLYGTEVISVNPETVVEGKVKFWEVVGRNAYGELASWRSSKVIIAMGGQPIIPPQLKNIGRAFHSSHYLHQITQIDKEQRQAGQKKKKLRFAVVGAGQSAAEIFNDLWDRFPESKIDLVIRGSSLKPSDDSPFVNEIFDPDRINPLFSLPPEIRAQAIAEDRNTNYSVVRPELIEHIYLKQYDQRLDNPNEGEWRCRILCHRIVGNATVLANDSGMRLTLQTTRPKSCVNKQDVDEGYVSEAESLVVNYVFTATGYHHNSHEEILAKTEHLLPLRFTKEGNEAATRYPVGRDYRIQFDENKVDSKQTGIWLQGCNEATHGLSDTLLSVLAVRGGELVESIFPDQLQKIRSNADLEAK